MMRKAIGLVIMLDGLMTSLFGYEFLRFLKARYPTPVPEVADYFLAWDEETLRWGAVMQTWLGAFLLWWR